MSTVYNGLVAWLAAGVTRRMRARAAREGVARSVDRRGVHRDRRATRVRRPLNAAVAREASRTGLAGVRVARRGTRVRRRPRGHARCATGSTPSVPRSAPGGDDRRGERPAGGDPRPRGAHAAATRARRRAARADRPAHRRSRRCCANCSSSRSRCSSTRCRRTSRRSVVRGAHRATLPYPPFTLVDQAVQAAASQPELARGKGFVNAVLRTLLRQIEHEPADAARRARLATTTRFELPAWWLDRLRDAYPADWQRIVGRVARRSRR